ncbi:MAG: hypothetical protein HY825_16130 [Acidobacteria bacterium]|nr:hypothetical protein [Acidobacteriota bacterium]
MPPPKLPPSDPLAPWWAGSPVAVAAVDALGRCLERIVAGAETRAAIVTAVNAIEISHLTRLEAVAVLEAVLRRYIGIMDPEVRVLFFARMIDLLDPRYYVLPWDRLLPRP